ncbi:hypothetical protein ACFQX7_17695 [Luedemannella flava]
MPLVNKVARRRNQSAATTATRSRILDLGWPAFANGIHDPFEHLGELSV